MYIVHVYVSVSRSDWLHPYVSYRGVTGRDLTAYVLRAKKCKPFSAYPLCEQLVCVALTQAGALSRTRALCTNASCVFLLAASRTDQDVHMAAFV